MNVSLFKKKLFLTLTEESNSSDVQIKGKKEKTFTHFCTKIFELVDVLIFYF